jgi:hypothetical protein
MNNVFDLGIVLRPLSLLLVALASAGCSGDPSGTYRGTWTEEAAFSRIELIPAKGAPKNWDAKIKLVRAGDNKWRVNADKGCSVLVEVVNASGGQDEGVDVARDQHCDIEASGFSGSVPVKGSVIFRDPAGKFKLNLSAKVDDKVSGWRGTWSATFEGTREK